MVDGGVVARIPQILFNKQAVNAMGRVLEGHLGVAVLAPLDQADSIAEFIEHLLPKFRIISPVIQNCILVSESLNLEIKRNAYILQRGARSERI